jgi:hypothetical protein
LAYTLLPMLDSAVATDRLQWRNDLVQSELGCFGIQADVLDRKESPSNPSTEATLQHFTLGPIITESATYRPSRLDGVTVEVEQAASATSVLPTRISRIGTGPTPDYLPNTNHTPFQRWIFRLLQHLKSKLVESIINWLRRNDLLQTCVLTMQGQRRNQFVDSVLCHADAADKPDN